MKTLTRSVVLGAFLTTTTHARGDIELVADINAATTGSSPEQMIGFGDLVLFRATTDALGEELLFWDRVTGEHGLLLDVLPGPESSSPRHFIEYDGRILFGATDVAGDTRLWETDGTAVGTQLFPATAGLQVNAAPASPFLVVGDLLYFRARTPSGVQRIHRTDGTAEGTFALDEPGVELTAVGNQAFFWKNTGDDLCVTEGTLETTECFDIPMHHAPGDLTAVGSWLYFAMWPLPFGGRTLWRSDGTQPVEVDESLSDVFDLVAHDGLLYFAASRDGEGSEVWRLDPATQAIEMAAELAPGNAGSDPRYLTSTTQGLFFVATTPEEGEDLWLLDDSDTLFAIDVAPGSESSTPLHLTAIDGGVVFTALVSGTGREPWFSDGTPGGAVLLGDLVPGPDSSNPREMTNVGGEVAFSALDPLAGLELHVTGGTPATTALAADVAVATTLSSDIEVLAELGGRSLFLADDGLHSIELWSSDGTEAGTQLLADINPGGGITVSDFALFQDRLLIAVVLPGQDELWWTGGTPETTQPLGFAPPVPSDSDTFENMLATSKGVYFEWGTDIWLTDGSLAGTYAFADVSSYFDIRELTEVGDRILFIEGAGNIDLIATDGTTTVDLNPLGNPFDLVSMGDLAFFNTLPGLWVTDGTPDGTDLVDSLAPGGMAVNGDRLFACGNDGMRVLEPETLSWTLLTPSHCHGPDPYKEGVVFVDYIQGPQGVSVTDGTVAGTVQLLTSEYIKEVVVAGEALWVVGGAFSEPDELWRSDGTVGGTSYLGVFDEIVDLTPVGDAVVFGGEDPVHGFAVWQAGPSFAPVPVDASFPGFDSSIPGEFARAGGKVLFSGFESAIGSELYGLPVASTGAWVLEPYGQGCPGTGDLSPSLFGTGPALLGGSFDLELEDALGGAAAALVWAPQRIAVPYGGGCSLYVGVPFGLIAVVATELDGTLSLTLPIPDEPALAGIPIHFQGLVQDPLAFLGAAATNGLETLFGS